jgi:endonuclease/exonuclease/phosphatase family metal-dependent hydrolase
MKNVTQVSPRKKEAVVGEGTYDFFKLLVWDLLLNKLLESEENNLGDLLNALQPPEQKVRLEKIAKRIKEYDIAVLIEAPSNAQATLDFPDDKFHKVMSGGGSLNTWIIAKREKFKLAKKHDYIDSDGQVSNRVIGCTLTTHEDEEIHVIAVHFSGKGYDLEHMARKIEKTIRRETILLGDFNMDLRRGIPKRVDLSFAPKFEQLVGQAKQQNKNLGTTNKRRSPFQAQVSKMFSPDFSMKDYVFLGDAYAPTDLSGPINQQHPLPSPEIPSDHAPLSFEACFVRTDV